LPAPQRTARIEDDIWNPAQAQAQAEGASLGALMRAAVQRYASGDLTSNALPASQATAQAASQGTPALVTTISPGEPSPGVLCMGPGCFQRDTRKYGLRQLPLCPACRAALVPVCGPCNYSNHNRLLIEWDPVRVANGAAQSFLVAAELERELSDT
jgi:hypothetical protein